MALLSDRGSLTERFRQVMGVTPHLTRLGQGHQFVCWRERRLLGIDQRQMALVREIKMGNGEQNWLFARTVVPIATLRGSAKRIANLNDAPIGKILFGRNGARRKEMKVFLTNQLPKTVVQQGIVSSSQITQRMLWQRESIFEFPSGPLMVSELFLPDCPIYAV